MPRKPLKLPLTSSDDLFTTQAERDETGLERIRQIPIAEIDDFPDHPFQVRMDDEMRRMAESKQLKTMGLLVVTDQMLNRVTENWKIGKRTHLFVDEFHVVFENEHSGTFFNSAWRRFRKRNAFPTAITQNVEYLLDSVLASTMLSNSECIVMLNQASADREKLAKLLNISSEQMSYITNAEAGNGLIKYGSSLVPFVNHFPKDTKLYKLMTTRPNEKF